MNRIRPSQGAGSAQALEIRETPDGVVHVRGLARLPVRSLAEVRSFVDRGLVHRASAATPSNPTSSRSHTVLSLYLPKAQAAQQNGGRAANSVLSFVDLAGSERLAKSKAEGVRFTEAVAINSALTALGKVVLALSSEQHSLHVPYRDSKLTRILSRSLAMGGQVALLATIRPAVDDYEESLNTLAFADRCKNLNVAPSVQYITEEQRQQMRIRDLQNQVAELREALRLQQEALSAAALGGALPSSLVSGLSAAPGSAAFEEAAALAKALSGAGLDMTNLGGAGAAGLLAAAGADGLSLAESQALLAGQLGLLSGGAGAVNTQALREERQRLELAQKNTALKLEAVERDRKLMASRREELQREADRSEKRTRDLQEELASLGGELQKASEADRRKRSESLAELRQKSEMQLQSEDEPLLGLSAEIQKGRETQGQKEREARENRRALEEKHREALHARRAEHAEQLREFELSWQDRLAERDSMRESLEEELETERTVGLRAAEACRRELDSVLDAAAAAAKVVADIEVGTYPAVWRAGKREAILPPQALPQRPAPASHPRLFEAMAKAESQVSHLERCAQRPMSAGRPHSADRLRHTVAAAAGRYDGLERLGPGAEFGPTPAIGGTEHVAPQQPPAASPSEGSIGLAFGGGSAASSVRLADALPTEPSLDLPALARALCDLPAANGSSIVTARGSDEPLRLLDDLSDDRLRDLCIELRVLALQAFAPSLELESLRAETLAGLEDQALDRYVDDLQRQRDAARLEIEQAFDRNRRLQYALESRERCQLTNRSVTMSALLQATSTSRPPSRPSSRPRTPLPRCGGSSRPASRPTTATSRPLSAHSGMPPRVPVG
eukprot:TRINITY_DN29523_c0_g7_i1.p1 TRINITY_DN29523_c0_g7~~TRINITY_DN29523_c0_g7_i1.p1  ORF type:complete len:851 (-),score=228.07 TRINITY_DN29523_c0_g7_i1:234-2786(-)